MTLTSMDMTGRAFHKHKCLRVFADYSVCILGRERGSRPGPRQQISNSQQQQQCIINGINIWVLREYMLPLKDESKSTFLHI